MTEVLWEAIAPSTEPAERAKIAAVRERFPAAAWRLIEAVRAGAADGMFPPVVRRCPEDVLAVDRHLSGDSDALLLTRAFADSRFTPLLDLLDRIDAWCRTATRRYGSVIAPDVLSVTNAELFGPVVSEAFAICAAGRTAAVLAERRASFAPFLSLFCNRLDQDLRLSWFADPALSPPVIGLSAHGAETHNGGQRVLRLLMSGGGRVAYKPRPAGGEALFLADGRTGEHGFSEGPPGSVFELLNELPPASGEIRLPVLRCRSGDRADRQAYSWQEWIEPPSQWGTIRRSPDLRLEGTRLDPADAARFWHRAGSLTAACFGFGISDLGEGNLLTGVRPADGEPLFFPVDLEIYFAPIERLHDTGLVADAANGDSHHTGLENLARWCTVDGPVACFFPGPEGALRLIRRREPCARERTRSVVADTRGRAGYGPYLPAFLRGMFDAWTLMCRHRDRIREFMDHACEGGFVRVLVKPTADYTEALNDRLLAVPGQDVDTAAGFGPCELEQLRRLDVPYFLRAAGGGPLLFVEPPPGPFRPLPAGPAADDRWPPAAAVRQGDDLDLISLGVAIRDAVEYAYGDIDEHAVTDAEHGVHVRLSGPQAGAAAFDWPQMGTRITYSWDHAKVRLRLDPIDGPDPATAAARTDEDIRRRLLRVDRVDAALRSRWTAGGFTDATIEERLSELTGAAMTWLREVVADHGWPGRALVGEAAAAAACRLVQHAEGPRGFQRYCLRLIRQAAVMGDVPWRQVAYVTDALCVQEGRPQLFGTKFRAEDGVLMPCPIERPDRVDERRERMGMEPLDRYAARLRRRFPLAGTVSGTEAS